MPIIKSAKKRVRVIKRATIRNAGTRRSVKSAVKAFQKSLTGSKKDLAVNFNKAQSEIAKAGKKRVLHKNKVARKQRQLAKAAKSAGVPVTGTVKKTAAVKKSASVKTKKAAPTKKPVAKKK
jgi:small subunit ribosomal protein S20